MYRISISSKTFHDIALPVCTRCLSRMRRSALALLSFTVCPFGPVASRELRSSRRTHVRPVVASNLILFSVAFSGALKLCRFRLESRLAGMHIRSSIADSAAGDLISSRSSASIRSTVRVNRFRLLRVRHPIRSRAPPIIQNRIRLSAAVNISIQRGSFVRRVMFC